MVYIWRWATQITILRTNNEQGYFRNLQTPPLRTVLKCGVVNLRVRIGDLPAPMVYALVHSPKYLPNGAQQRGGLVRTIGTGFVSNYH